MNNKFDELAKNMAQAVSRRDALRRFGVGLAATALSWLSLGNSAWAKAKTKINCKNYEQGCAHLYPPGSGAYNTCILGCGFQCNVQGNSFCLV